jgi:hypothetical protein
LPVVTKRGIPALDSDHGLAEALRIDQDNVAATVEEFETKR